MGEGESTQIVTVMPVNKGNSLLEFKIKDIKIRCVLVISIITDKRLGSTKPSLLSINDRQVEGD